MDIVQAFVLGMVQGLAEFLPISSSAHLILTPWFFGWQDQGLDFDVALHFGTLLAVIIYFRKDLLLIVKGFWHSLFKSTRDVINNIYQKLAWLLILATIPGAVAGKFLEATVEQKFRQPLLIAVTLSVVGLLLYIADWRGKKNKDLNKLSKMDALLVGISQAIALIPGVSRSGATMTTGLALGFKREDAAKFSFLLSVPITLGAGILKIPDLQNGGFTMSLLVGFLSAMFFGFLAIKFLLKLVSKGSFKPFVWYRLALAVVILVVYLIRI